MATHLQASEARPPRRPPPLLATRWLVRGGVALAALAFAAGASAQSFLANKKFNDTEVTANSSTTLTFDLFNSRAENLNATLTDTLPVTTPAGQLWFSTTDTATPIQGSATPAGGCTTGTVTFSDFLDAPDNTKAQTITITNAVVPPRPSGTVQPNCQIAIPVYTGAVSTDENVTNSVLGTAATASNGSEVFESNDFSATLRILAPVNPLPVTKAFSPALVAGGGQSTLTITVSNNARNPQVALSGVTFTDTLPSGLTAAAAPTFSSGCGSPSTTTAAGATTVQMSGGTIAIGATCTVTVLVNAPNTTEALVNTIATGGVTATGGYSNTVQAQATLNVRSEIKMTKAFGNNGGTSDWRTVDQPVPANLYGTTFSTTNATASVNQPVAVRVYFSNPTTTALTGGSIVDTLPGDTVAVGGAVTGSCLDLPTASIAAGSTTVSITGFTVPAATDGQPSSCYVQFYVKTTAAMSPAINSLSVGTNGNVTFTNTDSTVFPDQSTSARLVTTATGPGPGYGRLATTKSFITTNGSTGTSYTGDALSQAAHVNKDEEFWMRVAVRNTTYDVDYESGSITDTLPAGLRVVSPLTVRVMQNPPSPFGNGATVTSGCSVPGSVSVSGSTITYSGWTLLNAAGPNNTSPWNVGCFYNILLESDDTANDAGIDAINRILADDVSATPVGTTETVTASGDVAARVIVRSDLDTTKSFSPSTIAMGEGAVTRLTIAFNNKSADPITGLAVTDPLPSSASFGALTVADPPNTSNTCGGTLTATAGSDSVSLADGTVPGGTVTVPGSCQIEVDVVRTGGTVGTASITNTIAAGAVTNTQGQSNLEPVTATVTKGGDVGINVVKSFAESSALGGRAVPLTLDFSATSGSTGAQDQITLTDNLPEGMLVALEPNISTTCVQADGTTPADVTIAADRASFTISGFYFAAYSDGAVPHNRCSVTMSMVLTTTGNKTNVIPAGAISTDVFSTNPSSTQATLSAQPNTALQKQFSPSEVAAGETSTLTLSIVNVNTEARTDFELTDTFPAGMTVAGQGTTTCGDGVVSGAVGSGAISITGGDVGANETCTITVLVRAASQGTYVNGPYNITATTYIDTSEGIDELEVTPPPPTPPAPIPTLGEWAMLLLMATLAGLGGMRLRRRR
ncbi:MAG: IPTL-CTERM sorting domain-containing protein [Ottowia sp.]|uniref:beta strand repeat-containing protein n=1 Tax=Ottowia sp. TaxID=1898956 RepID=UPI0039E25999